MFTRAVYKIFKFNSFHLNKKIKLTLRYWNVYLYRKRNTRLFTCYVFCNFKNTYLYYEIAYNLRVKIKVTYILIIFLSYS